MAFTSESTLVPDDTNGSTDIFVRDLRERTTTRVSVSSSGVQGDRNSYGPSLSADGRYVAFSSWASNLVEGDTNRCERGPNDSPQPGGCSDVFVRDLLFEITVRVSVSSSGEQGNGRTENGVISADGKHVAFESWATNLVPGDKNQCTRPSPGYRDPPGCKDIFVHDLEDQTTELVTLRPDGSQFSSPADGVTISADGSVVAFTIEFARGPVRTLGHYVHDRSHRRTRKLPEDPAPVLSFEPYELYPPGNPRLTADGSRVIYTQGVRRFARCGRQRCELGASQIFDWNWRTGAVRRLGPQIPSRPSPNDSGEVLGISDLSISPDGLFAVFTSADPAAGGRHGYRTGIFIVAFPRASRSSRLVPAMEVVSITSDGRRANGVCGTPVVSQDGRVVAFGSQGTNLVADDTNGLPDIFVRNRATGTTSRASIP